MLESGHILIITENHNLNYDSLSSNANLHPVCYQRVGLSNKYFSTGCFSDLLEKINLFFLVDTLIGSEVILGGIYSRHS